MVDLNGSIDAAPGQFGPLLRALREAGNVVSIVSGVAHDTPDDPEEAFAFKVKQLEGLDCGDCWDDMTVMSIKDGPDLAAAKALWCKTNGAAVAIDNNRANAEAIMAAGIPLVLVPWETRTGNKNDGTSQ